MMHLIGRDPVVAWLRALRLPSHQNNSAADDPEAASEVELDRERRRAERHVSGDEAQRRRVTTSRTARLLVVATASVVIVNALPATKSWASDLHCTVLARPEMQARVCLDRVGPETVRGVVWLTNTNSGATLNNSIRIDVLGHGSVTCPWSPLAPGATRSCATPTYADAPPPQQASGRVQYVWPSGLGGVLAALSPEG